MRLKRAVSIFAVLACGCGRVEATPQDSGSDASADSDAGTDAPPGLKDCVGNEPNAPEGVVICRQGACLRIGDSLPARACETWENRFRCPYNWPDGPCQGSLMSPPPPTAFDAGMAFPVELCCPLDAGPAAK